MTTAIPYLLQGKNIILVIDSKSYTISKDTHMNYAKIIDALKAQDWAALRDIVEPKKAIIDFGKGHVSIDGDDVFWKGSPFPNALSSRMIDMYNEGFPIDPMVRFMENLMQNPSKRSVDQVYGFLEKNNLPITEDGHFLAYKRVREDYKDIHSGKFDNSVGQIVEMERNAVDDNPESYCSAGLHFCSETYLASFGRSDQPVMILKINPADVVSIPTDYNGAKGRCAKYQVVGQVNGDPKTAFASVVNTDYTVTANAVTTDSVTDDSNKAAWPFPTGGLPTSAPLFSVHRVYGNAVEHTGLTLVEAVAMVAKNARQKKAMLKVVDGTGKTVH